MTTDTTPVAPDRCPLCDGPISRHKYVEIQTKIREREKRKMDEQRRKIEEELRQHTEAFEKATQRKADARIAEIVEQRDAAVKKTAEIEEHAAELQRKAVEAEVTKAREALERDHERVLGEKAAETAREREILQKKMGDLQRQVAKKTSNELGDGAEIDLFEMLRDAFPDDRITRIGKGEPGADIKIEVLRKGEVCGVILIDSKNRKAWQTTFATKLREDQIEAEADHAILSTTAFPSGKRELCIEAGVIVARPGRVRELVQILRGEILKAQARGLSNEMRAEKRESLYAFITSEQFRQKMAEVDRLANELLETDVRERNQHNRTWENRGRMLRQQQRALSEINVEIEAILEGTAPVESE